MGRSFDVARQVLLVLEAEHMAEFMHADIFDPLLVSAAVRIEAQVDVGGETRLRERVGPQCSAPSGAGVGGIVVVDSNPYQLRVALRRAVVPSGEAEVRVVLPGIEYGLADDALLALESGSDPAHRDAVALGRPQRHVLVDAQGLLCRAGILGRGMGCQSESGQAESHEKGWHRTPKRRRTIPGSGGGIHGCS